MKKDRRPKVQILTNREVRAMLRRFTRCQIHFDVTEPMVDMLDDLAATGLYGAGSKHEVALRLVEDGLRRLQADGILFLKRRKR